MKFGKVLTYRDVEEAKKLIGKKVVASNILMYIDDEKGGQTYNECCLEKIVGGAHSFLMSDGCFYQFIREVIDDEPRYEPYDLSDPKVRKSLRGRWIIYTKGDDYTTEEVIVVGFGKQGKDYWKVIIGTGEISATELLENYAFDDGTPCGRRVYCKPGIQMPRDGKEDEK